MRLALDGASRVRVDTGAGIYDHFLEQLAFHARPRPRRRGRRRPRDRRPPHRRGHRARVRRGARPALGDRRGIARYGDAVVPMDDALARAAVDLGGRPHAELEARARARASPRTSSARSRRPAGSRVHVEASGRDAHHVAEAAFKAVGRALRTALRARSRPASRRRRACCERRRLRLPRRERPLGRDRAAPTRRRARRRRRAAPISPCCPGVGSAGSAMARAARAGARRGARARVADGRPVLGICLGLQLALEHSEEDGGVDGLASCPAARSASRDGRVPRIGWARGRRHGLLLRALVRGRDAARDRVVGGDRRRGALGLVPRRAVPPREERRAGARYLDRVLGR